MSNGQGTAEDRRQYYKSWVSYQIPMRPADPIGFEQTELLPSFYLAYFDRSNHLKRFVKYLTHQTSIGTRELPEKKNPNTILYFEALPKGTASDAFELGREVLYPATEGHPVYFVGVVDKEGDHVDLRLVRREIFFDDSYSYWPNGELKERILTKKDGTTVKTRFDEHGKELR
jgi:hypothetical protein